MVFEEIPIWVQCHNVPIAFMHEDIIRHVGSQIGRVLEVEAGEEKKCSGRYARIRISLDITKLLNKGFWVQFEKSSEEVCIILIYEKLPNFCFQCGKLGHVQRECDIKEGT